MSLGRRGHGAREGPWREGIGIGEGGIVDTVSTTVSSHWSWKKNKRLPPQKKKWIAAALEGYSSGITRKIKFSVTIKGKRERRSTALRSFSS